MPVQSKVLEDFRQKYWQNRVLSIGPSRARFDSGETGGDQESRLPATYAKALVGDFGT
jgi:hypothetical protein